MRNDPIKELENILSHSMTQSEYDPKSTQRERFVIDHLVEQVHSYASGEITFAELQAIFSEQNTGNFSLDHWMKSKVDEGSFSEPTD